MTFSVSVNHWPSTSKVLDGTLVTLLMVPVPVSRVVPDPVTIKGPVPVMLLPERARLVPGLVKTAALVARTRFAEMLLFVPPETVIWARPPLVVLSVMLPPPVPCEIE